MYQEEAYPHLFTEREDAPSCSFLFISRHATMRHGLALQDMS
jgi:hypothetical protein